MVKSSPKIKKQKIQQPKYTPNCPSCKQKNDKDLIKLTIVKIVKKLSTDKDFRFIKKYLDKSIIFLPDCYMQMERSEKCVFLVLLLHLFQQKI